MYSQMFELSADGRSDKDEVHQENHCLSFVDRMNIKLKKKRIVNVESKSQFN